MVSYTGLFIGVLSSLIIYPLDLESYGYIQFLYTTSFFLVHFASLGSLSLVIKFFPEFKDKDKNNHGFLGLSLTVLFLCLFIFAALFYMNKAFFAFGLEQLRLGNANIGENLNFILILTFLQTLIAFFTFYISNFGRIVVPAILQNFSYKIFLPTLILLIFFEFISIEIAVYLLIVYLGIVVLGLVFYTISLGQFSLHFEPSFLTKDRRKRMGSYWLFGLLQNVGSMLAFRIDVIICNDLCGSTTLSFAP